MDGKLNIENNIYIGFTESFLFSYYKKETKRKEKKNDINFEKTKKSWKWVFFFYVQEIGMCIEKG